MKLIYLISRVVFGLDYYFLLYFPLVHVYKLAFFSTKIYSKLIFQDDLLQSLNKSEQVTETPEDQIEELSPKSSEKSESDESSKPSESMTDYFQQGSSKLGHSLSSSNSGGSRPNFGFGK